MPKLTREKVAYLLRRFGLGASEREMAICEPLGVAGTLDYLLDYEGIVETMPVSPWESATEPGSKIVLERDRVALWWCLHTLVTQRPLEARLTLFWHNHFALGGAKVGFAPMFVDYLECLRLNATGSFAKLLDAVTRNPAMMRYLDTDTSVKGRPNENYARELMELFTIGPDSFIERDVQELARCFTGMGYRNMVTEGEPEYADQRIREYIERGQTMVNYSFTPALHDSGSKTIWGRTSTYDVAEVVRTLSHHPETVRRICKKLWQFFAMEAYSPKVEAKLVFRYTASSGNVKAVLREIAAMPEFWSEACVGQKMKSPYDFVVPMLRQAELPERLAKIYSKPKSPITPLPDEVRNAGYLVFATMARQGMRVLDPPDVGGWKWGATWITPSNMLYRLQLSEYVFGPGTKDLPMAGAIANRLLKHKILTVENVIDQLASIFDVNLTEHSKWILMRACSKAGGIKALKQPDSATYMLTVVGRLLFASPEFQFH